MAGARGARGDLPGALRSMAWLARAWSRFRHHPGGSGKRARTAPEKYRYICQPVQICFLASPVFIYYASLFRGDFEILLCCVVLVYDETMMLPG